MSNSLAQRCRNCGSRLPSYPTEAPQNDNAKASVKSQPPEIDKRNLTEPVDVDEYLAQLNREFSQ